MNPLQSLVRSGDREGAVALATSRLSVQPDDAEARAVLCRMQLASGELAAARGTLAQASPAASSHPDVQLAHVLVLLAAGQAAEAVNRGTSLAQLAPSRAVVQLTLGLALFERGDIATAMGPLRRATELAPDHFEYHHTLGEAALESGSFLLSAGAFTTAVSLQPRSLDSWQGLVSAYSELGQLEKVEPVVAAGVETLKRAPAMLLLWAQTLFPAQAEKSVALLEEARAAAPDSVAIREELARQLLGLNRLDASLAVSNPPDSARLCMTRAMTFQAAQPPRNEEAVAAYRQAMELDPDAWAPPTNLGMLLFQMGRVDEAVVVLEACWVASGQPQPLLNLALIRLATGHPAGPKALAQKVLELTDDPSMVEQAKRLLA